MKRTLTVLTCLLIISLFFGSLASGTSVSGQAFETLEGYLSIIYGDEFRDGVIVSTQTRFYLQNENGLNIELDLTRLTDEEITSMQRLAGKLVSVSGSRTADSFSIATFHSVPEAGSELQTEISPQGVTGSYKVVLLACKLPDSDINDPTMEEGFAPYFRSTFPGQTHYWREQSSGLLDLTGSTYRGWFNMPGPASRYWTTSDNGTSYMMELDNITKDCIGAADHRVNFADYKAIEIIVVPPPPIASKVYWAFGGTQYMSLDNVSRSFGITWATGELFFSTKQPSQVDRTTDFSSYATLVHELAHALGMSHSGTITGPYGSPWDAVSSSNQRPMPDRYIGMPYGLNGFHKVQMGWLPASKTVTLPDWSTPKSIPLERLNLPHGSGAQFLKLPLEQGSAKYYAIELRQHVGYDHYLNFEGFVLHTVDPSKYDNQAIALDDDGDGSMEFDRSGTWTPGETLIDAARNLKVCFGAIVGSSGSVVVGPTTMVCANQTPDFSPTKIEPIVLYPNDYFNTPYVSVENIGGKSNPTTLTFDFPQGVSYAFINNVMFFDTVEVVTESPLVINLAAIECSQDVVFELGLRFDQTTMPTKQGTIPYQIRSKGQVVYNGSIPYNSYLHEDGLYLPVITNAPKPWPW